MKLVIKYIFILLFIFLNFTLVFGQEPLQKDYQIYTGEQLKKLRVPIGGVGTGDILMGGRGNIEHIEVFNRPERQRKLIKSFFSIWMKKGGEAPVAKLLEREILPPYDDINHLYVYGLPRFQEVVFKNHFPIPTWEFEDPDIPLEIYMEAFNPFIPLDLDKSSYPIATFYWNIKNPTNEKIDLSIALNLENPIEAEKIITEAVHTNVINGLRFASVESESINNTGAMIIGTTVENPQIQTHWYDGRWRDDAHIFWKDFSDDGRLVEVEKTWTTKYKSINYNEVSGRNSSLLVNLVLDPGQEIKVPFYISWFFPKRLFSKAETFGVEEASNKLFENNYSKNFSSEYDIIVKFLAEEQELYDKTKSFSDLIQSSTFPSYVKEALTTQAASIKTNLIQITSEGDAHGFEGVLSTNWCCPGTCTHVWNYEQALASLFPEVERSMRKIEFTHNTFDNGFQTHRSVFPLGDYWFNGPAAADGQMGSIVRAYREWRYSGDNEWLQSIWPKVKKAMQFSWYGPGKVTDERFKFQESQDTWDPDKIGIMSGRQHNTYDISFFGPNSMTSSIYLAALKATAEMANAMNDRKFSQELNKVYNSGREIFEDSLWNGNYFIQIITEDQEADAESDYELAPAASDGKTIPKYQYGDGCLADQLLGQYLAHISGLGYILDKSKVDEAMFQVYQNNFLKEMRDFSNVQRVYALNDEAGVTLCSWPNGNRPLLPFVYSDEVWGGVEYQVAASLIFSDYIEEGLEIVKAIQDRHDGFKRNPFEHDESGVHYARAMASWSVLLALSGYEYDGVTHSLSFNPKINSDQFFTFWSTGKAWGSFEIKNNEAELKVEYGSLELKEFSLGRDIEQIDQNYKYKWKDGIMVFKDIISIPSSGSVRFKLK